jgi:hypothetical protein
MILNYLIFTFRTVMPTDTRWGNLHVPCCIRNTQIHTSCITFVSIIRIIFIYSAIYICIILFTSVLQLHLISRLELLVVIKAETFDSVRMYVFRPVQLFIVNALNGICLPLPGPHELGLFMTWLYMAIPLCFTSKILKFCTLRPIRHFVYNTVAPPW